MSTPDSRACAFAVSTGLLAAGIILALGFAAFAHDHNHPELNEWYSGLRSGLGSCCDDVKSEALHLRDVDWTTQDKPNSHYRVKVPKTKDDFDRAVKGATVETEWADVPDIAVISEPNRDGSTLVWPLYGAWGRTIRCFMPGTMT